MLMGSFLALAGSGLLLGAGCAIEPGVDEAVADDFTIQIRFHQGSEPQPQTSGLLAGLAPSEHTDVTRILVDITDIDSGQPLAMDLALTQVADSQWQGPLPSLPQGQQLRFTAEAFDASDTVVFSGETLATVSLDRHDIEIPLAPAQGLQTIDMPRLVQIAYPSDIVSGQQVEFVFTIEGNPGETIDYIISSPNSRFNPFSPATGSVTLSNTVADFVSLYTAPDVSQTLTFEHEVALSVAGALSTVVVASRFSNPVQPPALGNPIVRAPTLSVLLHPVILALEANGTAIPDAIQLAATISDDGDPAALVYQWRYTPNQGTPTATFANGGADNPAIFESYTVDHQGTLTFEVTDDDGGTTTLYYELVPGQFANAIDQGATHELEQIVAGEAHTCVRTRAGKVRCWGQARHGQLGHGNAQDIGDSPDRLPHSAGDVPLPDLALQLTAGDAHTCALLHSGLVYCWGDNTYGQLGYGHTETLGDDEPITAFGPVTLGGLASKIAANGDHTCAILKDSGALRCWGRNHYGQLGRGHTSNIGDDENVYDAGDVSLGAAIKDIVLGANHTCALLATRDIRCWGRNDSGQLGYGHDESLGNDEPIDTLANVPLPGPVYKIVAGPAHTCVLLESGAMRCWGYGVDGRLGNGFRSTTNPSYGDDSGETPIDLMDIGTGALVTDITAGAAHTCALLSGGNLQCWGYGANGRLGYGDITNQGTPPASGVDLEGISAYRITAGRAHTCALRSNGTARCWGEGAGGRLGHGATTDIYSPATTGDIGIFPPETTAAEQSHFLVHITGEQEP